MSNVVHKDRWNREIKSCTRLEIVEYCINDYQWQKLRIMMKGTSTQSKLATLESWYQAHNGNRACVVQIDNYLGALKRGGQIGVNGSILK